MENFRKIADGVFLMEDGSVLVANQGKLSLIAGALPGTIAFTAGYEHIWQLDTDGTTWKAVNPE